MAHIVVVGAGPAGLMAALRVARAGHDCTLLEAAERVGGMSGSFKVAGQSVDYGSHRLHAAAPDRTLELLRALVGDDLQTRPRNGRIRLRDRWVAFPLRSVDMLANLPLSFTARAALDTATGPMRRLAGGESAGVSFESEIRRTLGPAVAREFYSPYARKLYGVSADRLDVELARRRVSASGVGAILRRLAGGKNAPSRWFLYPRHGYGQISDALAGAASEAGVNIRLRSPVSAVNPGADGVTLSFASGEVMAAVERESIKADAAVTVADAEVMAAVERESIKADLVFSTMPSPMLARILRPAPDLEVTEALDRCRMRAMLLVYLVLDRPQYTSFDAHYLPGLDARVSRLSEPKNYRDGDDPADRTVLCAEIPCWRDDELWNSSNRRLGDIAAADLVSVGLPAPSPVAVEVRRLPSVYPVYETASADARATVRDWTRVLARDRVVLLGRQGLSVPDNIHHVLAMGDAAAASVRGDGTLDVASWHRYLDGFSGHVVQD